MSIKSIFFIFIIVITFSCDKKTSKKNILIKKDIIQISKIRTNNIEVKLNSKAKKTVANWSEYQNFDEFLIQYRNISSSDALLNANELSKLAKQLKDSIRIEKFQIPSVKIRLNVLHNETLRLADMSTINNISETDVFNENKSILNAFSALNLKINNLISQENLNSDVDEFIDEIINSSDSSKTKQLKRNVFDSIPKERLKLKKK
jgi:hypothetical protein